MVKKKTWPLPAPKKDKQGFTEEVTGNEDDCTCLYMSHFFLLCSEHYLSLKNCYPNCQKLCGDLSDKTTQGWAGTGFF